MVLHEVLFLDKRQGSTQFCAVFLSRRSLTGERKNTDQSTMLAWKEDVRVDTRILNSYVLPFEAKNAVHYAATRERSGNLTAIPR